MIIRSKAPLRLGLAGGGTDVAPFCDQYGGNVLNVTISLYAYCTIEPTTDGKISFYASDRDEYFECKSTSHIEIDNMLPLHKGVYNRIVKDFNGGKPLSFKMTTYADAPAGSGLGSSSTMVVALIKAYMEWLNLPLGEYETANLAFEIERIDLGLSGGMQDQYCATFGGLNFMEFYADRKVIVNPLRIKNWIKNELENSLVLYYLGVSRDSADIIREQIKNVKTKKVANIDAMLETKKKAAIMKEAILKGDFEAFADCLRSSWETKKKMASVISNDRIDKTVDFVMANGAKAAKISGAGGGGFMMIVVDPTKRYELVKALEKNGGVVYRVSIVEKGNEAWTLY